MKDILLFRRMITPILIQILFWLAIFICLIITVINIAQHHYQYALEALILGPLAARVIAEVVILLFQIYDALRACSKSSSLH